MRPSASTDAVAGNVFMAAAAAFWYHAARQAPARVLSAATWSKRSQQLEVALSQAIFRDNRELVGVLGTELKLQAAAPVAERDEGQRRQPGLSG